MKIKTKTKTERIAVWWSQNRVELTYLVPVIDIHVEWICTYGSCTVILEVGCSSGVTVASHGRDVISGLGGVI